MTIIDLNEVRAARAPVRSRCPDCSGRLTVLRIIPGRAAFGILDHALRQMRRHPSRHLKPVAEPIGA